MNTVVLPSHSASSDSSVARKSPPVMRIVVSPTTATADEVTNPSSRSSAVRSDRRSRPATSATRYRRIGRRRRNRRCHSVEDHARFGGQRRRRRSRRPARVGRIHDGYENAGRGAELDACTGNHPAVVGPVLYPVAFLGGGQIAQVGAHRGHYSLLLRVGELWNRY